MKTHYIFTAEKLTQLRNIYLETHSRFLLSLLPQNSAFKLESKTLMALHKFLWLWACLGPPCVDCAFCNKDITKHLFYVLIFYLFLSVSKFIPWLHLHSVDWKLVNIIWLSSTGPCSPLVFVTRERKHLFQFDVFGFMGKGISKEGWTCSNNVYGLHRLQFQVLIILCSKDLK